ncbi:MAG: hypothetical protein ABL888_00570 [Pirellulaceae bacterium]
MGRLPVSFAVLALGTLFFFSLRAAIETPTVRSPGSEQFATGTASSRVPANFASTNQSLRKPALIRAADKSNLVTAIDQQSVIPPSREMVENPANQDTPFSNPLIHDDNQITFVSHQAEQVVANDSDEKGKNTQSPTAKKSLFDLVAESLELSNLEAKQHDLPSGQVPSQLAANQPLETLVPRPEFESEMIPGNGTQVQVLSPKPLEPILPLVAQPFEPSQIQAATITDSPTSPQLTLQSESLQRAATLAKSSSENSPLKKGKSEPPVFQWETPTWLCSRLEGLREFPSTEAWAGSVIENLRALTAVCSFSDPQTLDILEQLQANVENSEKVFERAIRNEEQEAASILLRIRYDLVKSIALWRSCVSLGSVLENRISDGSSPFQQASFIRPSFPKLETHWQEYLLLDKLQEVLADPQANEASKRRAARGTLARYSSPVLSDSQIEYLKSAMPAGLIEELREMATEEVNLPKLMKSFETFMANKSGVHAAWIAREYQNLTWQSQPEANALANDINTHLRNANFRISVSDRWLNSLLPPVQETREPVNENVLGADVQGQSQIANRLQFRFIPDNSRIHVLFESIGRVISSTEASRSGFTVQNQGNARFHAAKSLFIGKRGIETEATQARSSSTNKVVGIASKLDNIPLLGSIARNAAKREIDAQQHLAKRHVERKLESTVKQRFTEEIDTQLSQLQNYLFTNLIEPLTILDLEPTPMETRSTSDRMIMRYRLAGRDQLAATTARPAGLEQSLMSMQIHESAINNLLNRMELNGNEFTVDGLRQHLSKMLSLQTEASEEQGETIDATIEFAPFDPIRLSFDSDLATVEFNLKSLQIGKGKVWKNITASANYQYQINGLKLTFKQDGQGVKVDGHRFNGRDQIAVRSIFTKIFRNDYSLNLLPQGIVEKLHQPMHVTQFDVIDGWIGVSFDNQTTTPGTVSQTAEVPQRLPIIRRK